MESYSKLQIGIASAVALGCAGLTYAIWNQKYRIKNIKEIFKNVKVKIITNETDCDKCVMELRRRSTLYRAIGFDCEWVTEQGNRHPVALIQMASYDGLCVLFRLNHMKSLPESLKNLLEDESIFKVGVAPADDARYLTLDYSVVMRSTLDIRHLAELCGHNAGGLASLSKTLLRVALDKSWRIRCSDWEAEILTDRQISYAAADAYVAIRMFVDLVRQYLGRGPLFWFRSKDDSSWANINDLCMKYADLVFKTKQTIRKNELKRKEIKVNKEAAVLSKRYPHATRSKPLYHNCFLEAPDGELLCTCDNKKAKWYVEKELADIVKEDPLTVRLRFEPSGRSVGEVGRYYQLTKENKCVVCGSANSYIRKNVVPREYRKYFPEVMKDHSSHDVVLLCANCHQRSNMRDLSVRERLADKCGAPLAMRRNNAYTEDVDGKKIRSAARALLYQSRTHVLPEARRSELENILLQHYPDHAEITKELLKEAADIQIIIENSDYECHGRKVVEYYLEHEGLLRLEEMWREHFLTSMRPLHMPDLWSIKHNEERLRVKFDEGRMSQEDIKLLGLTKWL